MRAKSPHFRELKVVYRLSVLLFLILPQPAFAGDLNNFVLKDGSLFQAEIVSYANGVYRLRSEAHGEFNLAADEILYGGMDKICCFTQMNMTFPAVVAHADPSSNANRKLTRQARADTKSTKPAKQASADSKPGTQIIKGKGATIPMAPADIESNSTKQAKVDTKPELKEKEATVVMTPVAPSGVMSSESIMQSKVEPIVKEKKAVIVATPVGPSGDSNSNATRHGMRSGSYGSPAYFGPNFQKTTNAEDDWPVLAPDSLLKLAELRCSKPSGASVRSETYNKNPVDGKRFLIYGTKCM